MPPYNMTLKTMTDDMLSPILDNIQHLHTTEYHWRHPECTQYAQSVYQFQSVKTKIKSEEFTHTAAPFNPVEKNSSLFS